MRSFRALTEADSGGTVLAILIWLVRGFDPLLSFQRILESWPHSGARAVMRGLQLHDEISYWEVGLQVISIIWWLGNEASLKNQTE